MFQASSVPIIRSYLLYTRQLGRFKQVMCLEAVTQLAWNVPSAEFTVDNSWWWAQKMPETYRVLWQNEFWIFDASSWFFYTKFISVFLHIYFDRNLLMICENCNILSWKTATYYGGFPEDGILSRAETCPRTNQ
jgi:hypothetical protein